MRAATEIWMVFVAGLILSGCQTTATHDEPLQTTGAAVPASLSPGQRPALDTDEAGLWMSVDRLEEKVRGSGNLIRDPALNEYVRGVVCRIAGPFCDDIRVYLVRVPHFNASMTPNGMMQVWSGLLLRARNEAQLAAVLGHEIGHYLRRHSLQRWRDARAKSDFLIFLQIGLGVVGVPSVGDLAGIIMLASIASFSRDNEREADRIGLMLMAKAGYDPREAVKLWQQLTEEEAADKDGDGQSRSVFFASHPSTEERIKTLTKLAEETIGDAAPGVLNAEEYRKMIAPLRTSFLRDEIHLRRFARAHKLVDMLIEDGYGAGELLFFRGELHRLKGDEEDLTKAMEAYTEAVETGHAPAEVHRSLGIVYQKLKRHDEARKAFSEYLRLQPDAEDWQMIKAMMDQTS